MIRTVKGRGARVDAVLPYLHVISAARVARLLETK